MARADRQMRWEVRYWKPGGATVCYPINSSGWATQAQIDEAVAVLARLTDPDAVEPDYDGE